MISSPIETVHGDVWPLIARELTIEDIIHLRASASRLRQNNHLRTIYQQRLMARPDYDDGVKRLELRNGQLYEGRYQPHHTPEMTLEHVTFFSDKTILQVWGTPVDSFVWCGMKDGLYQITQDKERVRLDQFDGMTPVNFVMAPHPHSYGSCNIFHFKEGLYVSGVNEEGQLGLGVNDAWRDDERLEFFNDKTIIQVLSSGVATYVHCTDGLYSFGRGTEGQLGLGNFLSTNIPTRIDFFNDKTITQIVVQGDGVFVLCEDHLFQFGTPTNIDDDPIPFPKSHPTPSSLHGYNNVTTILRMEPNSGRRNPLVHCSDGVYELQPQRGGWAGMARALHWYRETPEEATIKPAQPLIQQACSKRIQRYLKRPGKFHKSHANDLNSRILHCDGSVENLKALIEDQLALYNPECKKRPRGRYDPKHFSTGLRRKSKGPKGSYYYTLKSCQALLESVMSKDQVAAAVHL